MLTLCRLCALEKRWQSPIFTKTSSYIRSRIQQLIKIDVSETDALPKTVCTDCVAYLNCYHDFIQMCLESQDVLNKLSQASDTFSTNDDKEIMTEQVQNFLEFSENPSNSQIKLDPTNDEDTVQILDIEVYTDESTSYSRIENDVGKYSENSIEAIWPIQNSYVSPAQKQEFIAEGASHISDKECSVATPSKHTGKRSLYNELLCCKCSIVIGTRKQLTIHFKSKHSEDVVFQCPICLKLFPSYRSFTRHASLHEQGQRFVCKLCEKTFGQKVQLQNHIQTHSNDFSYECQQCGHRYRHVTSLYKHFRSHNIRVPMLQNSFLGRESLQESRKS